MSNERTPEPRSKPLDLENGPTKYIDRPANEGKHGDAAEEPNEGPPRSNEERETERRPKR